MPDMAAVKKIATKIERLAIRGAHATVFLRLYARYTPKNLRVCIETRLETRVFHALSLRTLKDAYGQSPTDLRRSIQSGEALSTPLLLKLK
jgi:hypothetical protein